MSISNHISIIREKMQNINTLIGQEHRRPLPNSLFLTSLKRKRLSLQDMLSHISI